MNKLSVVINVQNVEADLPRAIASVKNLADEIVAIDQDSSDKTAEIAKKLGAKIFDHKSVTFVELARNFGVSKATGDWILILDPDEEIPVSLAKKIKEIVKNPEADYYRLPRKNVIFGHWMRYSRWWPDYNIRLFKKGSVSWNEVIHAVPMTQGRGAEIENKEELAIVHHHYDSIEQYLEKVNRYTSEQAKTKIAENYKFSWKDLLNKPIDEFLSRYFFGDGCKDGVHGLALSLLQGFSELVLYLKIWQAEKFKEETPSLDNVISEMRKKEKELHYWQANAKIKNGGGIIYKIRRKFMI